MAEASGNAAGFLDFVRNDSTLIEMEFEKNTLLFGADPTPRIVAIELGET